jgi:hypothetical protein
VVSLFLAIQKKEPPPNHPERREKDNPSLV